MTNKLNDSLDDLLGGPIGEVRTTPVRAPADYQPRAFDEVCKKCRGTGTTRWGSCFACKGAGRRTFKTSPANRAKSRQSAADRRAAIPANNWEAFKTDQPAIAAWIDSSPEFAFAIAMRGAVERFGGLTDNQLAASQRCIEGRAKAVAARVERDQSAPAVSSEGVDRLKQAFDTAIRYAREKGRGLRSPKITIGNIVITPAKEASTNAGALYVKESGEYRGKIVNGRFFGRNCPVPTANKILTFIADPKAAAKAYGIETGTCCICNATLTNKESIELGIGPICATKFGW